MAGKMKHALVLLAAVLCGLVCGINAADKDCSGLDIFFIIDVSGSMSRAVEQEFQFVENSLDAFNEKFSDALYGLTYFGGQSRDGWSAYVSVSDLKAYPITVNRRSGYGSTPTAQAIRQTREKLLSVSDGNTKVIILLSDGFPELAEGVDNEAMRDSTRKALAKAQAVTQANITRNAGIKVVSVYLQGSQDVNIDYMCSLTWDPNDRDTYCHSVKLASAAQSAIIKVLANNICLKDHFKLYNVNSPCLQISKLTSTSTVTLGGVWDDILVTNTDYPASSLRCEFRFGSLTITKTATRVSSTVLTCPLPQLSELPSGFASSPYAGTIMVKAISTKFDSTGTYHPVLYAEGEVAFNMLHKDCCTSGTTKQYTDSSTGCTMKQACVNQDYQDPVLVTCGSSTGLPVRSSTAYSSSVFSSTAPSSTAPSSSSSSTGPSYDPSLRPKARLYSLAGSQVFGVPTPVQALFSEPVTKLDKSGIDIEGRLDVQCWVDSEVTAISSTMYQFNVSMSNYGGCSLKVKEGVVQMLANSKYTNLESPELTIMYPEPQTDIDVNDVPASPALSAPHGTSQSAGFVPVRATFSYRVKRFEATDVELAAGVGNWCEVDKDTVACEDGHGAVDPEDSIYYCDSYTFNVTIKKPGDCLLRVAPGAAQKKSGSYSLASSPLTVYYTVPEKSSFPWWIVAVVSFGTVGSAGAVIGFRLSRYRKKMKETRQNAAQTERDLHEMVEQDEFGDRTGGDRNINVNAAFGRRDMVGDTSGMGQYNALQAQAKANEAEMMRSQLAIDRPAAKSNAGNFMMTSGQFNQIARPTITNRQV